LFYFIFFTFILFYFLQNSYLGWCPYYSIRHIYFPTAWQIRLAKVGIFLWVPHYCHGYYLWIRSTFKKIIG
jgi:hypothetical protein